MRPADKASIFFGLYEGSEIRLVHKWLDDQHDVLELGGSLGVVTCHVARHIGKRRVLTVEASPSLTTVIERNLRINQLSNAIVIHAAIGRPGSTHYFRKGASNTTGTISVTPSDKDMEVVTTNLSSLALTHGFHDYSLVCDIEGSELSILLDDPGALDQCHIVIMETHDTNWGGRPFSADETKNLIIQRGFQVLDQRGRNLVFRRDHCGSSQDV